MSRVKTQQELDQEATDEAFARQLQLEADQAEQQQARVRQAQQQQQQQIPPPPQQQQQTFVAPPEGFHSGGLTSIPQLSLPHVRCTKCSAINTIQPAKAHLQQICGQCQKLLPPLGNGASHLRPAGAATMGNPNNNNANFQNPTPPSFVNNNNNIGGGGVSNTCSSPDGVLQGQVQPPQQIQARCGQCQSINALPIANREPGQTISFRCGQCQAVNRVTM
jgi:hypothetical protein